MQNSSKIDSLSTFTDTFQMKFLLNYDYISSDPWTLSSLLFNWQMTINIVEISGWSAACDQFYRFLYGSNHRADTDLYNGAEDTDFQHIYYFIIIFTERNFLILEKPSQILSLFCVFLPAALFWLLFFLGFLTCSSVTEDSFWTVSSF